jgi:Protein kinase domain
VTERSFGGYAYQQRLGTGAFGEVYRALSGAGKEARIIHVDPQLSARPEFARALVAFGEQTVPLEHPRVVGVRQVGRSGDTMVVVTEPVSGPVTLSELVARSGGRLPADIALAIGLGAVEGLAHAHSLRVVHGAVHPRSVLVDFHGAVKLGDFGLAWALARTAAESDDTDLLQGMRGYLAPELAFSEPATELSDVYAAGALLFELLQGELPPGELATTPELARVIERALATDPVARLINGSELEELLEEAIASDGATVAQPDEVAHFVTGLLAATDEVPHDDSLHAATDDLVAALAADAGVGVGAGAGAGLGLGESSVGTAAVTVPAWAELERAPGLRGRVTDLLAQLEEDAAEESVDSEPPGDMTEVDPGARLHGEPDLSELLRPIGGTTGAEARDGRARPVSEGDTPLPAPLPHRPGSVTRHLDELEAEDRALRRARRRSDEVAGADAHPQAPRVRHPRLLLWIGLTVFALAGLGTVLYSQTDLFDPGRRQAEERAAESERKQAIARHQAAQPVSGELVISAAEADAAVWLLLGRTPVDSLPLSAAMVHELRLEHEGYRPLDVRVTGYQWKDTDGALRADVAAELEPGKPRSALPAFPPAPAGTPPPGPRGRGVVHVSSTPSGAQVWLLIGFTPRATVAGLEAGRDYEFKVLKDGFRPGFAAVRSDEWYLSGPDGPLNTSLAREVTLEPRTERRAGKSRKRGRGGQARREKPR